MLICIEVSVGELLDKISILEIKAEKITDEAKLRNVRRELDALDEHKRRVIATAHDQGSISRLVELMNALKIVNAKIWMIEDEIRGCERAKSFGAKFVELARGVYYNNDERSRIKRAINEILDSAIVEEKSYAAY